MILAARLTQALAERVPCFRMNPIFIDRGKKVQQYHQNGYGSI